MPIGKGVSSTWHAKGQWIEKPHLTRHGKGAITPRFAKLTADAPPTTMWSSTRGVEWGHIWSAPYCKDRVIGRHREYCFHIFGLWMRHDSKPLALMESARPRPHQFFGLIGPETPAGSRERRSYRLCHHLNSIHAIRCWSLHRYFTSSLHQLGLDYAAA